MKPFFFTRRSGRLTAACLILLLAFTNCPWDDADEPDLVTPSAWLSKTLKFQRELQLDTTINTGSMVATHNSFNSTAYGDLLPNQTYSLTEQLEMGIRGLSLDIHWALGTKGKEIKLCHGYTQEVAVRDYFSTNVHLGCHIFDMTLIDGLNEINNWLEKNPDNVLLIDFQNALDGHENEAVAELKQILGDKIRPSNTQRAPSETFRQMIKSGKKIILQSRHIDSNTEWNNLFFHALPGNRYPNTAVNQFNGYPDCRFTSNKIDPADYSSKFMYIGYDSLVIPFVHNGPELYGTLTEKIMRESYQCGLNAVTLELANTEMMEWSVFSWARNEPSEDKDKNCAVLNTKNRWHDEDCQQEYRHACQNLNDEDDFKLTSQAGSWRDGGRACYQEYEGQYAFAVPINARQNKKLSEARDQAGETGQVWLNLSDAAGESKWTTPGNTGQDQGSPSGIPGLLYWFSGENIHAGHGETVTAWPDRYAEVSLESTNDTGAVFLSGALAGYPTLRWQSTGSALVLNNVIIGPSATSYVVYRNSTSDSIQFTSNRTSAAVQITDNSITVGQSFNGDVAEVIVFDFSLTAEDNNKMLCYLEERYSIVTGCQ